MSDYRINENGIVGEITGTACPTQAEGTVDGMHWYFRARWGSWNFAIADTPRNAVSTAMELRDGTGWMVDGFDETDGRMELADVWAEVRNGVARWRSERATP